MCAYRMTGVGRASKVNTFNRGKGEKTSSKKAEVESTQNPVLF